MPRGREDDSAESDYLHSSDEDTTNLLDIVQQSDVKTGSKTSERHSREQSRSLEWAFFDDMGAWNEKHPKFRKAKCKRCSCVVRSKRETMRNHILSCTKMIPSLRDRYKNNARSFGKKGDDGSNLSIKNFYQPKIGKVQKLKFECQMVRAAIASNHPLNSLSNPEYEKAFQILNPSYTISGKTTLRTTVFDLVSEQERNKVQSIYEKGCYISISIDGWVTPGHRKWFGVCGLLRSLQNGNSTIDARRFEDITLEGETEVLITRELKEEIQKVQESLAIKSKKHQLNLFAGNILTHDATKATICSAIDLINFFHTHPKQKARLQNIMQKRIGKQLEFVQYGNTRWYSHYQMILRIFRAKPFLEEYKATIEADDSILKKKICTKALDTIGATSFWSKLSLISKLLRNIVIEIGNCATGISKRKAYNMLQKLADRIDPNTSKDVEKRTTLAREFVLYLQHIEDDEFNPSDNSDPFLYWSCQSEIDLESVSVLRDIALFVFSAPASTADLERIWSSCLLNLTSRRRALKRETVLKTIQIKTDVAMEHESSRELMLSELREKHDEKAKIANLLDETDESRNEAQQSQQSQNNVPVATNYFGYSSSSESDIDEETEMGTVLKQIDTELQDENISSFANDLLKDAETEEFLDASEVQAYLDEKEMPNSPKKKRRKMPGYRRVTQTLEDMFDFDIYVGKSKLFYSSDK